MGVHDDYGKRVMRTAVGDGYNDWGESVRVEFGCGQCGRIDGTVADTVAVEIESRVSKQIRGAVLDLICHSYPKKLLVLLPVHMSDAEVAASQCRNILARFLNAADFRVIVLKGSGFSPAVEGVPKRLQVSLENLVTESGHSRHEDSWGSMQELMPVCQIRSREKENTSISPPMIRCFANWLYSFPMNSILNFTHRFRSAGAFNLLKSGNWDISPST